MSTQMVLITVKRDDGTIGTKEDTRAFADKAGLVAGKRIKNGVVISVDPVMVTMQDMQMPEHGMRREDGVLVYDSNRARVDAMSSKIGCGEQHA